MNRYAVVLSFLAAGLLLAGASQAQFLPGVTSGFNLNQEPTPLFIPFDEQTDHWLVDYQLTFDPTAGPMEKRFQSPQFPVEPGIGFPIWEQFALTPNSLPVSDWHEEILVPGWQWVYPPPESTTDSLITQDGLPWPWQHQLPPSDPTMLWVEFPPIFPPHVLDVHKQLVWFGAPDNLLWGDGKLDDGTPFDESFIPVLEYPTAEPTTLALLALGGLAGLRRRR